MENAAKKILKFLGSSKFISFSKGFLVPLSQRIKLQTTESKKALAEITKNFRPKD